MAADRRGPPTHTYMVGTTTMFSSVELISPERITIAIASGFRCRPCRRPARAESAPARRPAPSSESESAVPALPVLNGDSMAHCPIPVVAPYRGSRMYLVRSLSARTLEPSSTAFKPYHLQRSQRPGGSNRRPASEDIKRHRGNGFQDVELSCPSRSVGCADSHRDSQHLLVHVSLPCMPPIRVLYTEPHGSVYRGPASMPRSPRSRTPPDAAFWSSSGVQTLRSRTLPRSST